MSALVTGSYLAQFEGANADVAVPPGNWSVVHAPAAATQATASKTAKAGFRHICTGIYAAVAQPTATPVAFTGNLVLRDGATGAGTIIWQQAVACPATASQSVALDVSNLNLVGSVNTAMTLEFTAAPGTAVFETVTVTGYDIAA